MTSDATDATNTPAAVSQFVDGPTTEAIARYRMLAAAAARTLALALTVLAASWICGIVVDGIVGSGAWEYLVGWVASATVLLLAAWGIWQNADSLSGFALRAPAPGRCPACGFDLIGIADARCPECGVTRCRAPGPERAPSHALWHTGLAVALRAMSVFMVLWAASTWLNWLSYALGGNNVWPPFSWLTAATMAIAKILPPVLLWRWAPWLSRRALRGCEAWHSAPPAD
jgi:hypothetical protein